MKRTILIIYFLITTATSCIGQCWDSVAVGYASVFAIADNGTLWAWGKNTYGELGDGTTIEKNSPVQIGTDNNWKEVSPSIAPSAFTLAVKTDGTLWSWGRNNRGQLGDGTTVNRTSPVQVGSDSNWSSVAAGLRHSIAIKQNGTIWGWGSPERMAISVPWGADVLQPRQIGTDTDWKQASADNCVTVAVKTNNTVWGWGWNRNDMLNVPAESVVANDVWYPTQKIGGINVKATRTGDRTSIDIRTNNNVVPFGTPSYVKDIDFGVRAGLHIKLSNNTLWFAGVVLGGTSQIVQGNTQLGTATNWESVSVGDDSAAAINSNGQLYTLGSNVFGQLGIGTTGFNNATTPVLVPCPTALNTSTYEMKKVLHLYPNPAKSIFTLESDVTIDRLIIIDITGKELFNQIFSSLHVSVDVSQYNDGLYIIKAISGDSQSQIKFIKN